MQDAPDRETILLGLAKFLEKEVRPQLKDPRLGFRALVGAHLAFTAAMESMDEDSDVDAELVSLRELVRDLSPVPTTLREKKRAIVQLEARLADLVRDRSTSPAELETIRVALKATLLRKLRVNAPRFDTRADLE